MKHIVFPTVSITILLLANCATIQKPAYSTSTEHITENPTEETLEILDELADCVGEKIINNDQQRSYFLESYKEKSNPSALKELLQKCKSKSDMPIVPINSINLEMKKRFEIYENRSLQKDYRLGTMTSRQASCRYYNISFNFAIYIGLTGAAGFTNCIDYSGRRWIGLGMTPIGLGIGFGANVGFTITDDKETSTLPFSPFSTNGYMSESMWGAIGFGYYFDPGKSAPHTITKGPVAGIGIGLDGAHWRLGVVLIPRLFLPKNREMNHEWLKVAYFTKKEILMPRVKILSGVIKEDGDPKKEISIEFARNALDIETQTEIEKIILKKEFSVKNHQNADVGILKITKVDNKFGSPIIIASAKLIKGVAQKGQIAYLDFKNGISQDIVSMEIKKAIAFKGTVFSIAGNTITIATTNAKAVRVGQEIIFLDASGKEIGKGKITSASFTNIKVNLNSGRAEKDRDAVIYRN